MPTQDEINLRTLKTGSWLAALIVLTLAWTGHRAAAWGFGLGALLSLFSLLSLTVIVPTLFHPNASRHVKQVLSITLYMKLPVYCMALYLIARLPGLGPALSVAGIALSPAVITLKTLGGMIARSPAERRTDVRIEAAVTSQTTAHPVRPCAAELAAERG